MRETNAYLPYQVGRVKVFQPRAKAVRCDTQLRTKTSKSLVADFALFDAEGNCVAEATGFRFLRADLQQGMSAGARRFRFELLPLDHVTEESETPQAADIARILDFNERNAAPATRTGPNLDAIADELFRVSGNGAERNGINGGMNGKKALWGEAFAQHPAYLAELNTLMQRKGLAG